MQRKYKVSVQLSGHIRSMLSNIDSWYKNLILENSDFEFYFFLHTYNLKNADILEIKSKLINCTIVSESDTNISHNINIDKIKSHIQNSNKNVLTSTVNIDNVLSMLRKINECNRLSNNANIDFDYSIRLRPDIVLNDVLKINTKDKKYILVNTEPWSNCGEFWINSDVINDQIAIGDTSSINHYCNLYYKLVDYCEDGIIFHPESLLFNHLKGMNIIKQNIYFEIKR